MITWQDVPGYFDFQDIYDQAVQESKPGDILIEVGAWFGRSTLYMAEAIKNSGKDLRFYTVDKWHRYHENEHLFGEKTGGDHAALIRQHGSPFMVFAYMLERSGLAEYVRVLRVDSGEASHLFARYQCRMVYIDGEHTHDGCLSDLVLWYHAVHPGGIFAGHDYDPTGQHWPEVAQAVDECLLPRNHVEKRGNSWFVRMA